MAKVDKPNYTQIPNIILDNIDKFSNTEFKILLLICRKTFGWHKEKDKISYSQLIKTGLGKNTIPRAINTLKDNGYIIQTGSPHSGYSYELSIIGLTPPRVEDIPTTGTEKPKIIPTTGTTKESLNKLSKEKEDVINLLSLPECLNTEQFHDTWKLWVEYKKQSKKKLTKSTISFQIKKLSKHPDDAVQMIENSISNGWSGLFEIKNNNGLEEWANG